MNRPRRGATLPPLTPPAGEPTLRHGGDLPPERILAGGAAFSREAR